MADPELGAAAHEARHCCCCSEWNIRSAFSVTSALMSAYAVIRPFVARRGFAAPAQSRIQGAGLRLRACGFELLSLSAQCAVCQRRPRLPSQMLTTMKPIEEQASREIFDYAVNHVSERPSLLLTTSRHPSSSLFLEFCLVHRRTRPGATVWSLSCWRSSPTQPAAPPFGLTQLLAHHSLPFGSTTRETALFRTVQAYGYGLMLGR